ncbi:hypothetical protein BDN71DRAFT_1440640 [Pleurotus eryngii]|uniref:Uncharacterized protein n=1 Tax=Pleurotus eryngii TaxID=5323 RepID=A0A9P6DJH9_PLEER|nr:hypothetical protein BDN71DRAFT_1440640 [Pleurotus eryngii]
MIYSFTLRLPVEPLYCLCELASEICRALNHVASSAEIAGCAIRQRKFIKPNSANDEVCHSRMDTWTLRYRRPWMIERVDKLLSSVQTKTGDSNSRTIGCSA